MTDCFSWNCRELRPSRAAPRLPQGAAIFIPADAPQGHRGCLENRLTGSAKGQIAHAARAALFRCSQTAPRCSCFHLAKGAKAYAAAHTAPLRRTSCRGHPRGRRGMCDAAGSQDAAQTPSAVRQDGRACARHGPFRTPGMAGDSCTVRPRGRSRGTGSSWFAQVSPWLHYWTAASRTRKVPAGTVSRAAPFCTRIVSPLSRSRNRTCPGI